MKIASSPSSARSHGYALMITLFFLGLMLIVFASMMSWTTTNATLVERNNLYSESQIAAESATENAIAAMINDFHWNSTGLKAASVYSALVPSTNGWPIPMVISDSNGVANQITVSQGTNGWNNVDRAQLAGWGSFYTITAQATPVGHRYNTTARISQSVWFGAVPLFQYAIFYNMDMELNPGASMTVNGKVHSNQNIWHSGASSGSPLTYNSFVDASLRVYNTNSPLDPRATNAGRTGGLVFLVTNNNPLSLVSTIQLPLGTTTNNNNPTNVLALLNPPPAAYSPAQQNGAPYSTNGIQYFANAVDLIISNNSSGFAGTMGTNLTVYYQDPNQTTNLTPIRGDVMVTSNVWAYSFVTNGAFYDYREGKTVQSIDIDVGLLDRWITNGAGSTNLAVVTGKSNKAHCVNSIYAINSVAPSVTSSSSGTLPAVRMVDAQMLPTNGLTVVTPDPIYVKGNYNTTTNGVNFSTALGDVVNTQPAALMGDSITLLSSAWNDSLYTSTYSLSSRVPVNTTLNAATLEGIVPSNSNYYSGGVENFLRLLENWSSSTTVSYNGSIVVMFPSQYATNGWNVKPNIYGVPTRRWGFDQNFNSINGLPPLTPRSASVVRTTWTGN